MQLRCYSQHTTQHTTTEAKIGLDMYFYGRRYLRDFAHHERNDRDIITAVGKQFPEIRGARIRQVEAEFKYWRKANAVHHWFVTNVQDGVDECQESAVELNKLYQLRDTCAAVMADPDQASVLLPTQGGFFFGSTKYDEGYFDDVKDTRDWLNGFLLKDTFETLKHWDFYYRSSW
jgi:hypothetical protein